MLAGDTLRAAADLGISMIAVTLMHHQGYFSQSLDASGWQHEDPIPWNIERYCHELPIRTDVTIEGRHVQLRAWKHEVTGCGRHVIPVLLLDTDLEENSDWDRTHLQNVENDVTLAEQQLVWAKDVNQHQEGLVSDDEVKRLQLSVDLARLALERAKQPKIKADPLHHLQWQIDRLRSELLNLQVEFERVR